MDFRCENIVLVLYGLILPLATAPLLYYSAVKIEISSHNFLCIVFVTARSPYLTPICTVGQYLTFWLYCIVSCFIEVVTVRGY